MPESDKIVAPPYFSFKTLTNMLTTMEEHGPPNRIDRSFLTGMSGAAQTQFMAGLRSLGLIDTEGSPTERLVLLVSNPDDRPRLVGQIVRSRYPEAVELGSTGNATTQQLVDVFRQHYGVQGDTARKAIAFYLAAAKYAGDIRLSPSFRTPTVRNGGVTTTRRKRGSEDRDVDGAPLDLPLDPARTDLHPAIETLVKALPTFDGNGAKPAFPQAERDAWFAYAKATFNLIYALPEGRSPPEVEDE